MKNLFKFPDIGEGMHEGEIASWLVKVGDVVEEGTPVAEVQNDKLLQEILSPYAGKITKLFVEKGEIVEVGAPIIAFDGAEDELTNEASPQIVPAETDILPKEDTSSLVVNDRIRAMPSVRRYARKMGVDLANVSPTGKRGHLTLKDVQNYQHQNTPNEQHAIVEPEKIEKTTNSTNYTDGIRQPMSNLRKSIAKNMVQQVQNIPHVTLFDQVEVSQLIEHRNLFKEKFQSDGIRLTYLPYIAKSLSVVAKEFPELNANVDMETQEIYYPQSVNIGIAVDTPNGLFVPTIQNAHQKSIATLAKEITLFSDSAKNNTPLPPASDGTICISNIGNVNGAWFTPVINVNQTAILGVGAIQKEPIVNQNDEIIVGNVMKLSLSFDHRAMDGALAQKAMNYLKLLLASPERLLLEV